MISQYAKEDDAYQGNCQNGFPRERVIDADNPIRLPTRVFVPLSTAKRGRGLG
jgi:hypothetical protein